MLLSLSHTDNIDSVDKIKKDFDDAWKHHYTNNQHHPEFWSLSIHSSDSTLLYLPMSLEYVVEMVCDWIAVSMSLHTKITDWWAGNGGYKDKKNFECIDRVMDGINAFINDYGSKIDEECLKKG